MDKDGKTLLMRFTENGKTLNVLNFRNKNYFVEFESLLLNLIWSGKENAVKLLIESGVDVKMGNEYGERPLLLAVEHGN